jgi:hemerythrin-like metal-binding protein
MRKIVWDERLQMGIADVDQQNRQFVETINELIGAIQQEKNLLRIKSLLSDSVNHVNRHFEFEEAYLRNRLDPLEYSDHRERHLFFEDFLRNPLLNSDEENQFNVEELADFLADWVAFHIQHLDKKAFSSAIN